MQKSSTWSVLFGVAGMLLFLGGALLSYAGRAFLAEEGFARRVAQSFEDPRVSSYAAEEVTDEVLQANRDLIAVRPLLVLTVESALTSRVARPVLRTTARTMHRLLFTEMGEELLFTVDDVLALARSTLEQSNPALADRLPARLSVQLRDRIDVDPRALGVVRSVRGAVEGGLALGLLALGGLLLALGAFQGRPVSRGLVRLGVLLGVAGILLLPVGWAIGWALSSAVSEPAAAAALRGLAGTLLRDLRFWSLGLLGAGIVLSALPYGATLRGEPLLREFGRVLVDTPERPSTRVLRAVLLLCFGALLVFAPRPTLDAVAACAGAALTFAALVELVTACMTLRAEPHWLSREELTVELKGAARLGAALVAGWGVLLGVFAAGVTRSTSWAWLPTRGCNGDEQLCELPLDEVVFATTHNSMAASDQPGWLIPNQELGIAQQLEDGVRGFMIDVYWGYPAGDQVLTHFDEGGEVGAGFARVVGEEGVQAARRIRNRLLGEPYGPRDLYLCHGFCELGATTLSEGLLVFRRFLERHPREVLVIVVEDNGQIDPADMARALEASGLSRFIYHGPTTAPWPTLGAMIERGQRVLIGAEVEGGDLPWYHSVYDGLIQETPYHFTTPAEFSCAPHRGDRTGALFLLNHWITAPPAPLPSRAEVVNGKSFLLSRVEQCEEERGRRANLVAVDFYRTGALFEVVRQLNQRAIQRRKVSER